VVLKLLTNQRYYENYNEKNDGVSSRNGCGYSDKGAGIRPIQSVA
jgi:hypothetical protein